MNSTFSVLGTLWNVKVLILSDPGAEMTTQYLHWRVKEMFTVTILLLCFVIVGHSVFSFLVFLLCVRHLRHKYLTAAYFSISSWLMIPLTFSIPHPCYCSTSPKPCFSYLKPFCSCRFLFSKSDFLKLSTLFQHFSPLSPAPQRARVTWPDPEVRWGAWLWSAFSPVGGSDVLLKTDRNWTALFFKSTCVMLYL